MQVLHFTLTLHSDAIPGTGRGGDIVNSRVPRSPAGEPLPTTPEQLVGLMREGLRFQQQRCFQQSQAERARKFGELLDVVLGGRGRLDRDGFEPRGRSGRERLCRVLLSDVIPPSGTTKRDLLNIVARTAVDDMTGGARDRTLRVEETITVGAQLRGTLLVDAEEGSVEDLACRFALTSIRAVGGNRTRGGGRCTIAVDGETRSPGELLATLLKRIENWEPSTGMGRASVTSDVDRHSSPEPTVVLQLVFRAEGPICCPETPVGTGPVRSGFEIPASAVQGMVLTRLNRRHSPLADAVFAHPRFRAWPMLPCGFPEESELPVPVRVSLSHRVAKLAVDGEKLGPNEVADEAIAPFDWKETPDANPLKATGGVLLRMDNGEVALWKASSIPRYLSAHGVLFDEFTETGRNLFQMERIAPLAWMGFLCLPSSAAAVLQDLLAADPRVFVGRGKTPGRLTVREAAPQHVPWSGAHEDLLIVQSPVLLPDHACGSEAAAQDELKTLVERECREGKWAGLDVPEVDSVWVVTGTRFGWNRHGHGEMTGRGQRVKAARVVQPGAVIRFRSPPPRLAEMLQLGLGGGRERGFGSLHVHPGKASRLYAGRREVRRLEPTGLQTVTRLVLQLWRKHRNHLPSPSQIRAVQNRVERSLSEAREYLDHQIRRTSRIWSVWEPVHQEIRALMENFPDQAADALKLLADLCIADQKESAP